MINLCRATKDDAELLLEIKIRSFDWDVKEYGMGPPNYDSLNDLNCAINKAIYYKILFNEIIVGGVSLYDLGDSHFELGSIYIDPDYQGMGIGSKTIEKIEQIYSEIKRWTLDTPYKSFRNHYFYKKMGYVKIGELKTDELKDFILFKYEKNIKSL